MNSPFVFSSKSQRYRSITQPILSRICGGIPILTAPFMYLKHVFMQ